ncbi:MAG: RagB/SusD family nutrient uptake outer membrane protein [Hoylesella buccalis]
MNISTPKDGKLPEKDKNFTPKSEWFTSANIAGRKDIIKLNAHREPRFYAWMAFDGGDYGSVLRAGKPLRLQMRNPNEQGFSRQFNRDNSVTGYLTQKYVDPKFEYGSGGSINGVIGCANHPLRLAEAISQHCRMLCGFG